MDDVDLTHPGGNDCLRMCTSKETIMAYNEAKDAFQKATLAGAKKCAPCQYATAEAYLALADHEFKYHWRELEDLNAHIKLRQGEVIRSS